ncbi:MAG TPA: hypothetical protein VGH94_06010, partial [Acidimicrobiales bacterium]
MVELPSGTVTFLFTDLEGSTRRWEEQPAAMALALARHDAILETSIEAHGGAVLSRMGDRHQPGTSVERLVQVLALDQ